MSLLALLAALIQIGTKQLDVELASTPAMQEKGLMFRESLNENQGMLFVYEKPERLSFWMKNTLIPLSIGFFDENQILVQIEHMNPPKRGLFPTLYRSKKPCQFALEVNQGWFKNYGISEGDKFTFQDINE